MSITCQTGTKPLEIRYFNREKEQIEVEKVYGADAVKWLYGTKTGKVLNSIITQPLLSNLYGAYQETNLSRKKIRPFLKKFDINLSEYEVQGGRDFYPSFNDFFIRKFRPGMRKFVEENKRMPAFSEARYFGFESVKEGDRIPVKSAYLNPADIIDHYKYNEIFKDGPLMIARLCPVDYHRFHFPDDGKIIETYRKHGVLDSVNPIALHEKPRVFFDNEREVSIFETENFGKLAYIEVGATMVGKIVQTYKSKNFKRGEEKGYFLFGGSTVIVIGEKGKWKPSEDMLKNTANGIETYIKLGDEVAVSSK